MSDDDTSSTDVIRELKISGVLLSATVLLVTVPVYSFVGYVGLANISTEGLEVDLLGRAGFPMGILVLALIYFVFWEVIGIGLIRRGQRFAGLSLLIGSVFASSSVFLIVSSLVYL